MATLPVEKPKPLLSRIKRGLLFTLGILILVVAASFFTTVVRSNGELPAGVYRLHIRNAAGSPVEGAQLKVYWRNAPDDLSAGYFSLTSEPFSNAQGVMKFDKGAEGGGTDMMGWMLFWVFPITPHEDNNVSLEINAQGYEPIRFTETYLYQFVLLHHRHVPKTKVETNRGAVVYINLYELDFTLQEKK